MVTHEQFPESGMISSGKLLLKWIFSSVISINSFHDTVGANKVIITGRKNAFLVNKYKIERNPPYIKPSLPEDLRLLKASFSRFLRTYSSSTIRCMIIHQLLEDHLPTVA